MTTQSTLAAATARCRSVSEPLNAALAHWSLEKEQRAKAPSEGDEKEMNVSKSNWGGFQSYEEVFME